MELPPAQGGREHSPSDGPALARKDVSEHVKKLEVENSLLKSILDTQVKEIKKIQINALEAEAIIGESNLRLAEIIKQKNELILRIDILTRKLKVESEAKEIKIRDLKIYSDLLETSIAQRQKENNVLQVLLDTSLEAKINEEKKSEKCQAVCEQIDDQLFKACGIIIKRKKEIQQLGTLLKESEDEKAQLKGELAESLSEVSDTKEKLSEQEKVIQELNELIDKKDSLTKELIKLKEEKIKKNKEKIDKMKTKLQNMKCEKYDAKNKHLQQKVVKLEETNNQYKKEYESQILSLESKVRTLEEQKEQMKQEQIKKEKLHKLSENQLKNEYSKVTGFLEAANKKLYVYKDKCQEFEKINVNISVKFQESENSLASMNDTVTKLQAEILLENLKFKEEIQKSKYQEKLNQNLKNNHENKIKNYLKNITSLETELKASMEKTRVAEEKSMEKIAQISELQKSLDEKLSLISSMQDSKEKTRIAEEECLELKARISEFQNSLDEKSSLIASIETQLEASKEKNCMDEKKCMKMSAQISEKENSCAKLFEQVSELQTLVDKSNQELQKSHEMITNLENSKEEYQKQMTDSLAKQNVLEKELKKFYRSKNMLKQDEKTQEMSKVVILENVLSNIKKDFANLEIKLKNKETLLELNNSFISNLTFEIQQLKEVVNQQEITILDLNKPNTYQDFLLHNQQREVEGGKSAADLEDDQFLSTSDIVETSPEVVDTPEESTKSSYAQLIELVNNIHAGTRNDEAKADKFLEQISSSMVTIANLTEEIDTQKLTLQNNKKLIEEQIIEIEKLQKEKESLEKIIQKQNVQKDKNLSFEEKKQFQAKICQLEGKLCIANGQCAALEEQLHEAQSQLTRLETHPQSSHAQNVYNRFPESKFPTTMRGSHDAWQPDPPQEHRPRISPQLFYGTSTRAPPRQFAWSNAMQQTMCGTCGSWFHSRQELWHHSRTVHGKFPRIEPTSQYPGP